MLQPEASTTLRASGDGECDWFRIACVLEHSFPADGPWTRHGFSMNRQRQDKVVHGPDPTILQVPACRKQ